MPKKTLRELVLAHIAANTHRETVLAKVVDRRLRPDSDRAVKAGERVRETLEALREAVEEANDE